MSTTSASACPKIVVVGGGAGGLELVTQLGKKLGRRGQAEPFTDLSADRLTGRLRKCRAPERDAEFFAFLEQVRHSIQILPQGFIIPIL